MDPIDICDASAMQPFVACMDKRGIDAARYLERQGIPPELVHSGGGKIFKRKAWDFFRDVTRREDLGTLGFLDGDPFTCDDLGSLGVALQQGVTLQDSIGTLRNLIPSFAEGNTVWLERGPERSWLCCHTARLDPSAHVPNDFTLTVLIALVRLIAGPDWLPLGLRCQTQAPRGRGTFAPFEEIETTYRGDSSAIALPTALLSKQPIAKPCTAAATDPALEDPSIGRSLQQVLSSLLPHQELPTCQETSELLGINRRTLHRALQEEGLTYRHVVERVRFDAARHFLEDEQVRITDIAAHLGYSSPSNFVRAFRRMSGQSPERFRRSVDQNREAGPEK